MPIRVSMPPELTPEQNAQAAWVWLHENCAPSTWEKFAASIAVRQPQVKGWPTS